MSNQTKPAPIDKDELWEQYSETIPTDIDGIAFYAGRTVMLKEDFFRLFEKIKEREVSHD